MSIDKGMFNYQDVMSKFYNYEPDKDDSEGRAIKNSFMSNMVQSGYDASLAKDMAFAQSGIAKGNMTHAADLELRNKTGLMNDEFNKGSLNMGQQFEMQNRFAEDQNVRDITKDTTAAAVNYEFGNRAAENQNVRDITKDSIGRADNYEYGNRLQENQNVRDINKDSVGRADQFEYNNQMAENQTTRDVTKDTYNQGATFDYQDKLEDNRNIRDMANKGLQGDEQRKTLAATGTQYRFDKVVEGEQQRYGIMQTGDETRRTDSNRSEEGRETMREGDRIEAGKENRHSARSRAMARAF